jgi:hypothetical protein
VRDLVMGLYDLLREKKTAVLEKWFQRVVQTYPPDSARFFQDEHDRFLNPVGAGLREAIQVLYDELLGEMNAERISRALDSMVRVRSVQDFSASEATGCVFFLKEAIREVLQETENRGAESSLWHEFVGFSSKVDAVALRAFDLYANCREKLFQIKVQEIKAEREKVYKLLESADRVIRNLSASRGFPTGALSSDT